jgi:hypothetical protein
MHQTVAIAAADKNYVYAVLIVMHIRADPPHPQKKTAQITHFGS